MEHDAPPLSDQLVAPLLQLLQLLRSVCGGDLEKNIILLAVAERSIAHPEFKNLGESQRLAAEDQPFASRGVNVRGIADSTGMPRESVRRKVKALIVAGWLEQVDGHLHFTPEGYRALSPARVGLQDFAARAEAAITERRRMLG